MPAGKKRAVKDEARATPRAVHAYQSNQHYEYLQVQQFKLVQLYIQVHVLSACTSTPDYFILKILQYFFFVHLRVRPYIRISKFSSLYIEYDYKNLVSVS